MFSNKKKQVPLKNAINRFLGQSTPKKQKQTESGSKRVLNNRDIRSFHVSGNVTDDEMEKPPYSTCFEDIDYTGQYSSPAECFDNLPDVYPPKCLEKSDIVYVNGMYSPDQTFYNCIAKFDQTQMPTFYNGSYNGCSVLGSYITLLNLVEINEVQGYVTLQVLVDIQWFDPRYNMELFWEYTRVSFTGYDVTRLLTNQSVVMWRPEITFPDAAMLTMSSESLKLYHRGEQFSRFPVGSYFVWEALFDITLVQPGFDFTNYPNDYQNILIRYDLQNYDAKQMQLYPRGVFCSNLADGSCSFGSNPIWTYNSAATKCNIYYDAVPIAIVWPAKVQYIVQVSRQGNGVIVRLIFPITLLLLLSALTFWITVNNRVNITITLLLSVSALYIVILNNIPMVGYLTTVDEYVFYMFLLLCGVVTLHQIYATMYEKCEKWPLRFALIRLIELGGRTFVPTFIFGYFLLNLEFFGNEMQTVLFYTLIAIGISIFYRELFGLKSACDIALDNLVLKVNDPECSLNSLAAMELFVLNRVLFRTWSTSPMKLSEELSLKGKVVLDSKKRIRLKNAFAVNSLLNSISGKSSSSKSNDSASSAHSFTTSPAGKQRESISTSEAIELSTVGKEKTEHVSFSSSNFYQQSLSDKSNSPNTSRRHDPVNNPLSYSSARNKTAVDSDDEEA